MTKEFREWRSAWLSSFLVLWFFLCVGGVFLGGKGRDGACLHKASSKQPHCCEIQSSPFYLV